MITKSLTQWPTNRGQTKFAKLPRRKLMDLIAPIIAGGSAVVAAVMVYKRIEVELSMRLLELGLISIAYELFLRRGFVEEMQGRIEKAIAASDQYRRLESFGIVDADEDLSTSSVAHEVTQAEKVRILQTWIPDLTSLLSAIKSCLGQGGEVRILLMKPTSVYAAGRAKQLGYADDGVTARNIEGNLVQLAQIKHLMPEAKLDVRLYDEQAPMTIYGWNDTLKVGLLWSDRLANEGPQMLLGGNDGFTGAASRHFEEIWERAEVVGAK